MPEIHLIDVEVLEKSDLCFRTLISRYTTDIANINYTVEYIHERIYIIIRQKVDICKQSGQF